jgi:asparagine synthase (glutamine-hydrolysing)
MCGIAGELRRNGVADATVVERQLQCLLHRGPDAAAAWARGRAAVGQTRLAVIDLVTGDPPITNEAGDIGVAFNGEIYTYRELRAELAPRHTFRTMGDSEVLAHLAEELDPVALAARLTGMFAFAVWDSTRQRLVLGRDRVGKKPLYWWDDGRTLVFGSEIKAVLDHPAVTAELDESVIPAYLRFGYAPTPRTFFRGIRSLRPGHVLVVDDRGVEELPYWRPDVPRPGGPTRLDLSMDEAATEVRRRLRTAVERRLVSDVPLGAFLSGGIDSSAIVALMAELATGPVRTFTIGFDGDDARFDERRWARLVADRFGTEHHELVAKPSAVDLVERLVWHHDQPFGDSSAVPTFLLSEMTREHVTVALCGDGGDELFAGYERVAAGLASARAEVVPAPVRRALARAVAAVLPATGGSRAARVRRFADAVTDGLPDAYRRWVQVIDDDLVEALVAGRPDSSVADHDAVWARSGGAHPLDRLLLLNLETYLLDDLLPKVDRTSMAVALEVRAPFLDHDLIELALRLPPSTKVRGLSLKRCLKAAMADVLPDEILRRPKKGFGVPLDRWFRDDLATFVDGTLASPTASIRRHVSGDAVARLLAEHRAGRADHGHALWTLLTLEVFLRSHGW